MMTDCFRAMTTLRQFTCDDLFRFNGINLDPLTEMYGLSFYLQVGERRRCGNHSYLATECPVGNRREAWDLLPRHFQNLENFTGTFRALGPLR